VTFNLDADGKIDHITMKAVSPLVDFSWDYQDCGSRRTWPLDQHRRSVANPRLASPELRCRHGATEQGAMPAVRTARR
jgi:hypothetical protein